MLRWIAAARAAVRALVNGRRAEDDLREELQYHLDRQIAQGIAAGLPPDEARAVARRAMGPIEKSKEECRDVRPGRLAGEFLGDLRYALRNVRTRPASALLVVGIMAVGIGANTAVFSVIKSALLDPLPYDGADRIVTLTTRNTRTGEVNPLVSIANYRDWRDRTASFEAMAVYRGGDIPVGSTADTEYVRTISVDAAFFRVFGVRPSIGRLFLPEEMQPGTRSLLISDAYWRSHFGGDPGVLGREVRIGNDPWRVIGVMPPGFQFPANSHIWTPLTTQSTSRTAHNLFAVGRLKPGTSLVQGQAELQTVAAGLEQQYPDSNTGRGVAVRLLQDELVGDMSATLYLLWGAVFVVLLIACANTATLLLGRASARTHEFAVRAALGASRARLIRQLVTESLLLACLAGGVGVVLAVWGQPLLVSLAPGDVASQVMRGTDAGVLLFTLAVSVVTGVLFGLVPARQATNLDLVDAIKQQRSGGQGPARTRSVLVVTEIALASVLLISAGVLIKSLVALQEVDLGFAPERALVMKATAVGTGPENNRFFGEVLSRISALPGVAAAGATSTPPGDLSNSGSGAYFIDRIPEQRDRSRESHALFTVVAPNTFAALGIPLTRGRDFSDGDAASSPLVAVVNEALVRASLDGQDPIGRTIYCPFDKREPMTIVGVVGDVRQRDPSTPAGPECYMPYTQHTYNNRTLYVVARTAGDATMLSAAVRSIASEVSPGAAASVTTMEAVMAGKVQAPRFRTLLFTILAVFGTCLAMAGVYGVMAGAVAQRSREIGLRMALGAGRGAVLRMILLQAFMLAFIGVIVGLAAAAGATRWLTAVLFEVQPTDAHVYLGVAALMTVVTLAASGVPAWRAICVDPVQVLKAD